jgi:hypothetical protein
MVSRPNRSRRLRRSVPFGLVSVAALVAGCELAETVAPQLESRAVVHAVLNPLATQQLVIVEKTLRSLSLDPGEQPFTRDPILGARVVVYGPRQDSSVAVADAANAGVYRLSSVTIRDGSTGTAPPNVLRIRPGERYRLRIETSLGVVTGETTVPVSGPVDGARRTFNVDRDTLRLDISNVRNAAGFLLRHETRTNVMERYRTTVGPALVLPLALVEGDPDDQEWSFSFARGSVLPGLAQNFVVVAVDSNYFRYYAAGFDPFGDDTRGNSLTGGVGMFGSVQTVMSKTLDLTAEIDSPVEGSWMADRSSLTMPLTLTLYSSPYFPRAITGLVSVTGRARSASGRNLEAYGTMSGTSGLSFEFVDPTGATVGTSATGLLSSGAIVLTDTRSGERVTYRKP